MTRRTKVVVCVIALATLTTAFVVWIAMRRGPTFDDSDLAPAIAKVPFSENAFSLLGGSALSIYWPASRQNEIAKLADGQNWDAVLAQEVLSQNSATLALFDDALARAGFRIHEPKSFEEDYPYLSDWKELGQLASIRAFALFHQGKEQEAFDAAEANSLIQSHSTIFTDATTLVGHVHPERTSCNHGFPNFRGGAPKERGCV
jgi:hypothetical protein